MPSPAVARDLNTAYQFMRARFGYQAWWPADTPFEVCVGAILTQNTSWRNVERAIANLKAANLLSAGALQTTPEWELEGLLRPAGYFRVKCGRLKSFVAVLAGEFGGDLRQLFAGTTAEVRSRLLSINGVGPETADSMLLYAGGHLSFVVDAYTKRVFARHGWCQADADYHELQRLCSSCLIQKPRSQQLEYWQDYHAQLVMVGKRFCSNRKPLCLECPLKPLLPEAGPQELSVKRRRSPALSAAKDYGPA